MTLLRFLSIVFYYRTLGRPFGPINTIAEWEKVTIYNPGPDGIAGTSDDEGDLEVWERTNPAVNRFLITNPKQGQAESVLYDLWKTMKGIEIIFNKKFSNRWQMIASYQYGIAKGNVESVNTNMALNPNNFVNLSGGIRSGYYGQPHQFKLQGSVLLPLDINFGVVARYISGLPVFAQFGVVLAQGWQIIMGDPPDDLKKMDDRQDLDIRAEKRFSLFGGNLSVMADVFNVLNSDELPYRGNIYMAYGSLFGKISSVKPPRSYRIGLRFVF